VFLRLVKTANYVAPSSKWLLAGEERESAAAGKFILVQTKEKSARLIKSLVKRGYAGWKISTAIVSCDPNPKGRII